MRRPVGLLLLTVLLATSAGPARPAGGPAARGPRLDAVTLVVRHRVFHDFFDVQRVKLNQDFILGDTDFTGRVVQYVPDFEMDLASHRIVSRSEQPNNPAFRVVVRQNKTPQDTSWAFLNMPPHFGRHSYFAFQVVKVEFLDRAPLVADTTSRAPAAPAARPRADSSAAPPAPRDTVRR